MADGIRHAFENTCERWKISDADRRILLGSSDTKDRMGYVVAISLGLGSIFNENPEAERIWLTTPRDALGGKTALAVMVEGDTANLIAVKNLVSDERNL